MALQKKDFIEIEFTGKIKDTGDIFDSNIKEELDKLHISQGHKDNHVHETKPLVYCLGEGMFLEGVDNFLIGKEIGKHKIELSSENAFGKRQRELVKMIPIKIFFQHKINPVQGAMLNFDGKMGKILSVSGGRVLIDFNHPLAGKDVIYEINVKKIIQDIDEKIKAFNNFIFKQDFKFSVAQDNKKVIYEIPESDKQLKIFIGIFKEKFKEIFDMELEIKEEKTEKSKDEQKAGNFLTNSPQTSKQSFVSRSRERLLKRGRVKEENEKNFKENKETKQNKEDKEIEQPIKKEK
ncbi:MAG: FKBP-type peptidyl-prolyl cis-trans isomerase [Nanoarchaeota archaeon]|nr:FKBP-type peptidyl-prolyl cis-trans isomerase [Nanoarchaeota archaeon]